MSAQAENQTKPEVSTGSCWMCRCTPRCCPAFAQQVRAGRDVLINSTASRRSSIGGTFRYAPMSVSAIVVRM